MAVMRIPLAALHLTPLAQAYAIGAIETGWTSGTGAYIGRFEAHLRRVTGREQAVAVANGTLALEALLRALRIGRGDQVIVPALTFVAPAAAVLAVGAEPLLVDIHPQHWTLDPDAVAAAVTPRTAAIIAVDTLGHPADYGALLRIATSQQLALIEDAAEAHGAAYKQLPVGRFGTASTFSFHANKTVPIGEGGAVLTNDARLADKVRLIVNHGMTAERPYWHDLVGSNYRLTNIQAALGCGQAQAWDTLVQARQQVARRYDRLLEAGWERGLRRRPVASWATEAVWLYTVQAASYAQRQRLVALLRAQGIDARPIWTALPDLPLYRPYAQGSCGVAKRTADTAFWLPTYADLTPEQQAGIADLLLGALEKAA